MPNNYIDDFFECIYNEEIEQKQHLDSADSFLVGILGALIGVGAYLIQLMAKAESGFASTCLWSVALSYFLALTGGVVCTIASIVPRFKEYISSPQQWAGYVTGCEDYYGFFHEEPERSDRVALELRKLRRQQYIQAGETNRNLIYTKHAWQTRAKQCLITAVVFMLACGFPVYFIQRAEARKEKNEQRTPINPVPAAASNYSATPKPTTEPSPADKTSTRTTADGLGSPATPAPTIEPTATPGTPNGRSDSGRGDAP